MEGTIRGIDSIVIGITFFVDSVKEKIILKPKDLNAPHVRFSEGESEQQGASSSIPNSPSSTAARQRQQQEATGKLIRSILSCNETGQNQSSKARPTNSRLGLNGRVSNDIASLECDFDTKIVSNDKFRKKALHGSGSGSEKHEKHTRNKDRPDHGIWSPLHCPDVPKA
ncbi:hypothetical protein ES319_D06G130600v1, partial [Gossypium barbadense]